MIPDETSATQEEFELTGLQVVKIQVGVINKKMSLFILRYPLYLQAPASCE